MADTAIAVAHSVSPFVSVYRFNFASGFSTRYGDPATIPVGTGFGVSFSNAGNAIAVAHASNPFVSAYPWSDSGFGVKYTNPGTLPASIGNGVTFRSGDTDIAVAHYNSPSITVYSWSAGFGAKYANPVSGLPAGTIGFGVAWSPNGADIAVAHSGNPYISVWAWSSGFGTKYTNPATFPDFDGSKVAFSPSGSAIAVANIGDPFITAYPWTSGSGFGAKYTNPTTLPNFDGSGIGFRKQDSAIAATLFLTPAIAAYGWSVSGFGSIYTPPTLPSSGEGARSANNVQWHTGGDFIAIAHDLSPFLSVYPWDQSTGFGTKLANPAVLPTGNCFDVSWLPSGQAPFHRSVQGFDMAHFLRKSTENQRRAIGPFVSDADFTTLQTGLNITTANIKLSKNGGAAVSKDSGGGPATHIVSGFYGLTFNSIDTGTIGEIDVIIKMTGALIVWDKFFVVEPPVYDALFAPEAEGFPFDDSTILSRLPQALIGGRMSTYRYHNKGPRK